MRQWLRSPVLLVCAVLYAANLLLNLPIALPGASHYPESIEPGYVGMARFFAAHPSPFGWNPLQYFGLPAQMWYLPVIPYLGAVMQWLLPSVEPLWSYRALIVVILSLGPVTLLLFIRYFTGNLLWSTVAAAGYTVMSPAYWCFQRILDDIGAGYLPRRVHAYAKWGEGPHNLGLVLFPLALIACWRAAVGRRPRDIVFAAILMAAITLTNWISSFSLAICCLLMLLTGAGLAPHNGFLGRRIIAAGLLGYLLAAFWLTPTFVYTVLFNWPKDSFNYQMLTQQRLLLGGLVLGVLLIRLLFLRFPHLYFECFCSLALFAFGWCAFFREVFLLETIPESRRYIPEAEFFFYALAGALLVRLFAAGWVGRTGAVAALAAFVIGSAPWAYQYIFLTWERLWPLPVDASLERNIARSIGRLKPDGRVMVTGTVRFQFNAWEQIPQFYGTFESGLENRIADQLYYRATKAVLHPAFHAREAELLLRSSGVQYVAMHEPRSEEYYHDFQHSHLFRRVWKEVYRSGDDVIYELPFQGYAHLVRESELLPRFVGADILKWAPYVDAMDDPRRPRLQTTWDGTSSVRIEGRIPAAHLVATRISWHSGWSARQDGWPIPVRKGNLGFLMMEPRASSEPSVIELTYSPPAEQVILSGVSAAAWGGVTMFFWRRRSRAQAAAEALRLDRRLASA